MLDAYTVRKAIPRILIAVIGINLSIYLCIAMIDITNIIGSGLGGLITAPFDTAGLNVFEIKTDKTNAIAAGVGIAVGAGPAVGAITTAIAAVSVGGIGVITTALSALFFMLIPIIILVIAILGTVVIRQALLFFLTVISPVAIACFVLPGTEKYFKKWLDLFVKTLLVYPIIAVIFAVSDVFASIIFSTTSGGVPGLAKIVTGLVVIFAPLFLIPFAFRLAGGAIAQIAKVAGGLGDKAGQSGFIKSRREFYGQRAKDNFTRGRVAAYNDAANAESTSTGIRRSLAGYRKRRISGYKSDVFDREAELNKRMAEQTADTTNYGNDALQRAYTVNKEYADAERQAGRGEGALWRHATDENGVRTGGIEYQSAGGSWQSEASVNESKRKFGNRNTSQWQASMAYEMKKANTQQQQDNLVKTFGETMDTWGASANEANSSWIGSGFANQDKNRQWKHGRWSQDNNGRYAMQSHADNLITEVDENIGSYQGGQSNADTWTTMAERVQESASSLSVARGRVAGLEGLGRPLTTDEQTELGHQQATVATHEDTLHRASRVVNSIRSEQQERDENGVPTGRILEEVGSGAPGHTKEAMRSFAKITDHFAGRYVPPDDTIIGQPGRQEQGHVQDDLANRSNDRRAR